LIRECSEQTKPDIVLEIHSHERVALCPSQINTSIENVDGCIILIYNRYFYSVVIYLAQRALERCACFKSTNTAAGVIPSILLAAPCDSKGKILISFKLIAPEI
jgi:hypothetical protein